MILVVAGSTEDVKILVIIIQGLYFIIGPVREFMDYVNETRLQHKVWKVENWAVFGLSIRTN